ncbi:hypothetical protein JTE90_016203 [Oedothorax gibbosus]|uniref:Fanconi anemia group B protein n=1 Tax=Oedothorax gibbosus TaxID=931172 RepID=A0AAV6UME8_9ARAC|nr:hypothetical protein JTE90_016203 [Oedothorax gibbosus]
MSNELTVVDFIGEINVNRGENTIIIQTASCSDSAYDLFLTFKNTCKIYFCKFVHNVVKDTSEEKESNPNNVDQKKIKVLLWKTFVLPFVVKDLFVSSKSLWVLGQDILVDIKQHVENVLKSERTNKDFCLNDDSMDIDKDEEFSIQDFESVIKISPMNKHKIPRNASGYKLNLINEMIIMCTKNLEKKLWHISITGHGLNLSDNKIIPLVDLPFILDGNVQNVDSTSTEPVVTFMSKRDFSLQGPDRTKHSILHKLLSIDAASSNCICIIGHPNGKVLYIFCSKSVHSGNFKVNSIIEELCCINQPIVGIYFMEEIRDCEFILIVGSLGKLVFISTEKLQPTSEDIKIKSATIYSSSLNVSTFIFKPIVHKNCIFYLLNNGDLWLCKILCEIEKNNAKKINVSSALLIQRVADIELLDNSKGFFLVVTSSGYLNVHRYAESKEIVETSASMPFLMNEIMHQSTVLKNLAEIASYQHKFFAAISTFANLKHASHGLGKWDVSCSVHEINQSIKKFIVCINFNCSDQLNSEFWFVSVSLYSHFQKTSALVSKTIPFNSDLSFNIEVHESLLCQPHAAPFPIQVEVGLLLTIPEKLKNMPCFQLVSKELPMYLRIQTFILNELNFMKTKTLNSQNHSNLSVLNKNMYSNIHKMSMNKPISRLFDIKQNFLMSHHQSAVFRLLTTTAQEIVNSESTGPVLANEILQLLLQKSHLDFVSEDSRLLCRSQPVNVTVSAHESNVCITIHADSFLLLTGIRMAIMEILLNKQKKSVGELSQYIQIPAALNNKCEEISKDLLNIVNKNLMAEEFFERIMFIYNELRSKVSSVLPFS